MMLVMRLVFFVVAMIGTSYGLHRYLWVRLARDPGWSSFAQRGVAIVLVMLLTSIVGTMILVRSAARETVRPLAWVAFTWMGVAFFLAASFAFADLLRLALPAPVDEERRLLFARIVSGVAAFAAMAAAVKGAANVRAAVRVVEVPVVLPRLRGGRSWRVVQISDVHVGPTIGREFLAGVVDRVNAQAPDVVVITGDLVDGSVANLAEQVAPLGRIVARHGVYFITGNHEYYSGAVEWCEHLATLGIRVLRNESVPIGDDDGFTLAGVDDWTAHQFERVAPGHKHDMDAALRDAHPARPVVLLAHQPKSIREAQARNVDLQLSGHTHGGQIFPFMYLVSLQQPYVAGLERVNERTQIYVSRGTGYWGPPMRLGAPAEITVLHLRSA